MGTQLARPRRKISSAAASVIIAVGVVDELVSLILAQRNYEINSRAIRVSDDMLQQVNNMVR